jgi:hypothetical protein
VLERLDPQAGEGGAHELRQALGERHEVSPVRGVGWGQR